MPVKGYSSERHKQEQFNSGLRLGLAEMFALKSKKVSGNSFDRSLLYLDFSKTG